MGHNLNSYFSSSLKTAIPPIINSFLCPVYSISTLILPIVRTAICSLTGIVSSFFTKFLFVIDTIGGIIPMINPSLYAVSRADRKAVQAETRCGKDDTGNGHNDFFSFHAPGGLGLTQ